MRRLIYDYRYLWLIVSTLTALTAVQHHNFMSTYISIMAVFVGLITVIHIMTRRTESEEKEEN